MAKQIIVIGAGMGGLSAAIHARLYGNDVLVLEKSGVPGGKAAGITMEGFHLDPGPSIIILPQIYESVFRRAGGKMEDYLHFQRLPILSRIFFGKDNLIDLPADEGECLKLLSSFAPRDAQQLGRLLDKLGSLEPALDKTIYDHPFSRPSQLLDMNLLKFGLKLNPLKRYKDIVDNLFESPLVKAFFYGFPSYSGQSYEAKSPSGLFIPFYMLRHGSFFPVGGVRAIPAAFYRLAVELGVEFRFNQHVAGLDLEGDRVAAVRLSDGEKERADVYICNVENLTLGEDESRPPSYSYFTLQIGLRHTCSQLEHHNLFIPTDFERSFEQLYHKGEFPDEPIVYVNYTRALDSTSCPPGQSIFFAVVTTPAENGVADWKREEGVFRDRVLDSLLQGGIEISPEDIIFERRQSPPYFAEAHGNYRGSLYGFSESERLWGMFPRSNQEHIENLAYCGGWTQPGAGMPMVTLSGRFAADLVS
jgi:phytoene desaturase